MYNIGTGSFHDHFSLTSTAPVLGSSCSATTSAATVTTTTTTAAAAAAPTPRPPSRPHAATTTTAFSLVPSTAAAPAAASAAYTAACAATGNITARMGAPNADAGLSLWFNNPKPHAFVVFVLGIASIWSRG